MGIFSALARRLVGESVAHLIDVLIALPTLVLALVLVAALGGSLWTVSLAIGFGAGVVLARVVRARRHNVLTHDYIVAADVSGSSTFRTIWRHILPNIGPTVIVQLSIIAAFAVLAEAALSYLGLTPVATPSWGRMLETLQQSMTVHPWAIVFPGSPSCSPRSASTCSATGCVRPSTPLRPGRTRRPRRRRSPSVVDRRGGAR